MTKKNKKNYKIETLTSHSGLSPDDNYGIVNPPVYHASTILSPTMKDYKTKKNKKYTYGRNGTPTTDSLEYAIAKIYDAKGAVLAPSGMGAISNSLMAVLKSNDHALFPDCVYGSARRFVIEEFPRLNIQFDFYNQRDLEDIKKKIRKNTKVLYIESPGTYTFEIIDIKKVVKIAKDKKIVTIIDNTWGTALYFNAIKFGIDIVCEAITKYIGGHSDVMLGVSISNKKYLSSIKRWRLNSGQSVGPDDVFLALRGLRTLPLRLEKSYKNSKKIASFFSSLKEVKNVFHPALNNHPDHKLWKRDFSGASGIFGIEFQKNISEQAVEYFADCCILFGKGASWGGFESLMTMMDLEPNRSVKNSYLPDGPYLRIYVGLENIEDLINDIENAINKMRKKYRI